MAASVNKWYTSNIYPETEYKKGKSIFFIKLWTLKKKCDNFAEPSFLLNVLINILQIRKARRSDKKGTQNIWLISFTQ